MPVLEYFVLNYPLWSYLVLFLGMFIEGEVFFLTAAVFAKLGYLDWSWIAGAAFAGVVLGDVAWFYLGKFLKNTKLGFFFNSRFSAYHEWLDKNFLRRYWAMAFLSKFLYYVNRLTPLIAGWHDFEFKKFLKIHFLAAIFWTGVNLIFGYFFGLIIGIEGIRWLLRRFELFLLIMIVVFICGEYLLKRVFSRRIQKDSRNL